MNELSEAEICGFLSEQVNEKIEAMEQVMLEHDQVQIPVEHRFINGMYAREILIPKGTMLTGRVHKFGYVDIMLSGDITVATPDGTKRLTGVNILEGVPGRKRAGYAHEDTRWITVHNTEHSDPATVVEHLTYFSMGEYRAHREREDRDSYAALLQDLGMSEAQVQAQVQNLDDQIRMPDEYAAQLELKPSPIHGTGMFARTTFQRGDHIAPARIAGDRTEAGRYVNHSALPNACMVLLDNGDAALAATRLIAPGDEITTDYRATIRAQQEALCHPSQLP